MGFILHGNDPGTQILKCEADSLLKQTFLKGHDIFTGVLNIYEGFTIAKPKTPKLPILVKELARSSSGEPCIMCFDDQDNGRIVIDTGYTKLFEENYT